MTATDLERRLRALEGRGVTIVDPRQTFVAADVDPQRLGEGVILHPGTRLEGPRTFLASGSEVGREGPTVLRDCVLGPGARVESGFGQGAVLLRDAVAGAGAHLRHGTLLEEEASTAHCVGLKHTILLSFVTIGSLVNFCDCLMAGGTSRRDHSEVGSGFIHFNFTPWGVRGDKATPSLVGDVVRGVFLREARIFLGGAGGMVGPRSVGYGSVVAAGQVLRRDVGEHRVVSDPAPRLDVEHDPERAGGVQPRAGANLAYIAQLVALRAWYRDVRQPRASDGNRPILTAALENIGRAIDERCDRLSSFLAERGVARPALHLEPDPDRSCPLDLAAGPEEHVAWVQGLSEQQVHSGQQWLRAVADDALRDVPDELRPA